METESTEEVAENTDGVAESVVWAIGNLGSTVSWRFRGQEIGSFLEDLSYALTGLGDVLDGLAQMSGKEVTLQAKALVFLSEVAQSIAIETLTAYHYHAQQTPST